VDRKLSGRSQVRALVKDGQIDKAIATFEGLLTGGEGGPYDFVYLGDLLVRAGRGESAVARYEDAIAAYAHLGFHRNALAVCRKILRLDPQRLSAYRQMGELYAAEELYGDALHAYFAYLERVDARERESEVYRQTLRRAEELAPRRAEFAVRLSDLLVQLDRPDAAAALLRESLQQASRGGAVEAAAGLRERLAAIDPAQAAAAMPVEEQDFDPVAETGEAAGEDDETVLEILAGGLDTEDAGGAVATGWTAGGTRAAVASAPGATPGGGGGAQAGYGEIDFGVPPSSQNGAAGPAASQTDAGALARGETDPGAPASGEAGLGAREPGETDAAAPVSGETPNRLVERADFATHYALGCERMEGGELEAALESFAAAAWDDDLQPEQARLLQEAQARCLAGLGRHREAVRELLLALQRPHKGAESAELTYLLALEYEALGELDEARRRLHEALELCPDYPEARARLSAISEEAA